MTFSMGQRRWKESWSDTGSRRNSLDLNMATKTGPKSTVSSLTDISLDRSNTRASFLLREHSSLSSHVDSTNYQEKLQGWSTVFHDNAYVAPRPCTSINAVRTRHLNTTTAEIDREWSFLQANKSTAFPEKPRELYDPLEGLMPTNKLVAQRKYYVLPSIGMPGDLVLRRQHTSMDTLNQLDYPRDKFEDDAEFFSELIELNRDSGLCDNPNPHRGGANPLPPIQKLTHVVRPRTNIAELDEDRIAVSGRQSLAGESDTSDIEVFRARTPDPDASPRKLDVGADAAFVKVSKSRRQSTGQECESVKQSVPVINVEFPEKEL